MRKVIITGVVAVCAVASAIGFFGASWATDETAPSVDYTHILPPDLIKSTPKGKLKNP